jgi:hypothetical protein
MSKNHQLDHLSNPGSTRLNLQKNVKNRESCT